MFRLKVVAKQIRGHTFSWTPLTDCLPNIFGHPNVDPRRVSPLSLGIQLGQFRNQ